MHTFHNCLVRRRLDLMQKEVCCVKNHQWKIRFSVLITFSFECLKVALLTSADPSRVNCIYIITASGGLKNGPRGKEVVIKEQNSDYGMKNADISNY